jgi:uncharacterized membrane protein YqjE
MSRHRRHRLGEPSQRSLGLHLVLFTAIALALAFTIVLRPVPDRAMQLATVMLLLAALGASAWFLTRPRRDIGLEGDA